MLRGLGTGKTAKQTSKFQNYVTTRQIEFSDAFKTKIGSCHNNLAKSLPCEKLTIYGVIGHFEVSII